MQREARVSAAIEILDIILREVQADGHTTVQVLRYYFADRDYVKPDDKKNIQDIVFAILRLAIPLSWALEEAGGEVSGRNLVLAHCEWNGVQIQHLFGSGRYGPDAITDDERGMLWALPERDDEPDWARRNCPEWMFPHLKDRFGAQFDEEMAALEERAPFTARVNTLKAEPTKVLDELMKAGVNARLSARTPNCIFMSSAKVKQMPAYKDGRLDLMDQGHQIASILVAAKPGMRVLDMCCGRGNMTGAIAAWMKNKGSITATDINPKRVHELASHMDILGVDIAEGHTVSATHEYYRDQIYGPLAGQMDRVVLDAPSSGSGIWRQHPEYKIRIIEERLPAIIASQRKLMKEAATLVKPDGRMIYVVGSFLAAENEDQVKWFLKNRAAAGEAWKLLDYRDVWGEILMGAEPRESLSTMPECLQLAPAASESNGCFIAILERG